MKLPRLRQGSLVVLEGLDRTGKTTQFEQLRDKLSPDGLFFVHLPTGFSAFTRSVRDLLEESESKPASGYAQQLAHLACHAEAQPRMRELRNAGAVVLDRWWWSTLAYGWYGGAVRDYGVDRATYDSLINSIWRGVEADVVFLFDQPHRDDYNNSTAVQEGYREIGAMYPETCVLVQPGSIDEVRDQLIAELDKRNLLSGG